ncbi:MAG: hypothetical protein AAFR38_00025 [Planctomycetota bacterium]
MRPADDVPETPDDDHLANGINASQDWSLDYLGNWSAFAEDTDGSDGSFGVSDDEQTRAHDDANQLGGITGSLVQDHDYDPNGILTSKHPTATPADGSRHTYDA